MMAKCIYQITVEWMSDAIRNAEAAGLSIVPWVHPIPFPHFTAFLCSSSLLYKMMRDLRL
jgi:hypothetical protein